MTLLTDFGSQRDGSVMDGIYRIRAIEERKDRHGRPFVRLTLADRSAIQHAYAWPRSLPKVTYIQPDEVIRARLGIQRLDGRLFPRLLSTAAAPRNALTTVRTLDPEEVPRSDLARRLERILRRCPVRALQQFLDAVFQVEAVALPYLSLPASRAHHHSWPGGLAEHSLEVARSVYNSAVLDDPEERALATIAALLHDLGKVRTFSTGGYRSRLGQVVPHTAITLEMLAEPLSALEKRWPDGAIALRYLLTWRSDRGAARPLLPVALLIEQADRYSAAQSARRLAQRRTPPWNRFSELQGPGPRSLFWSPSYAPE